MLALATLLVPLALLLRTEILWAFSLLPGLVLIAYEIKRAGLAGGAVAEPQVEPPAPPENSSPRLNPRLDQLQLLRELGTKLLGNPSLKATFEVLLGTAREISRSDTVALFLERDRQLSVVSLVGESRTRVEEAALKGLTEPAVGQAWKTRISVLRNPEMTREPRIFEHQDRVLALPVGRLGVLYLGSVSGDDFEEQTLELLHVLADHAAVAIGSALRYRSHQEALELHASSNEELQQWVERLRLLLEGAKAMASTLDEDELIGSLQALLQETIPHEGHWVVSLPSLKVYRQPQTLKEDPGLQELLRFFDDHRKAIMIDDLGASRFQGLGHRAGSMLAAPLFGEGQMMALVILTSLHKESFTSTHFELLQLVSLQTAAALGNIRLHHQAIEAQAQLNQSERQLFQSSKLAAVGQLAAGVAHELNSPLGAARLAIEFGLQSKDSDPQELEASLGRATRAIHRAEGIIKKLLYYSRTTTEDRVVCLKSMVEDALTFLRHDLDGRGVAIKVQVMSEERVQGNQNELHQVLNNLVLNARDSVCSDPRVAKQVLVTIRSDGQWALLEVSDPGPGIAPEDLSKVFDPFYTTKGPDEGTGLGLSVSHELVRRHQGTLSVVSEPYRKTTFTLKLPRI